MYRLVYTIILLYSTTKHNKITSKLMLISEPVATYTELI